MKTHILLAVITATGSLLHLAGGGQVSAATDGSADSSAWTHATYRIDYLGAGLPADLSKFAAPPSATTLTQVTPAPANSSQDGNNRGCSAHNAMAGWPAPADSCSTKSGSSASCSTSGNTPGGTPEGTGSACSAQGGGGGSTKTCSSYGASDSTASHCSGSAGSDQCCSARGGTGGATAQCSSSSSGDTCSVNSSGNPGHGWGNACSSYAPTGTGGTAQCSAFHAGAKCSVFAGATQFAQCTSTGGAYPGGGGGWCSATAGDCSVFGTGGVLLHGPVNGLCSPSATPTPTPSPTPPPPSKEPSSEPSDDSVLLGK